MHPVPSIAFLSTVRDSRHTPQPPNAKARQMQRPARSARALLEEGVRPGESGTMPRGLGGLMDTGRRRRSPPDRNGTKLTLVWGEGKQKMWSKRHMEEM
jgi:hypothetical protein